MDDSFMLKAKAFMFLCFYLVDLLDVELLLPAVDLRHRVLVQSPPLFTEIRRGT